MRGKSCSMDGLPDFTPSSFYVPGERHENLPVNTFAGKTRMTRHAGLGTPVQSLWADKRPPEYATGGSGMFQGADFGHGKLIALHGPGRRRGRMGQDDSSGDSSGSSLTDLLSQGLSTASDIAQAVTPGQAAQAATTAPSGARPAAAAAGSGFMSKKVAGIPMVAILVLAAGAGAFFYMRKKK